MVLRFNPHWIRHNVVGRIVLSFLSFQSKSSARLRHVKLYRTTAAVWQHYYYYRNYVGTHTPIAVSEQIYSWKSFISPEFPPPEERSPRRACNNLALCAFRMNCQRALIQHIFQHTFHSHNAQNRQANSTDNSTYYHTKHYKPHSPFHQRFVRILLADGDHCMLARRHGFLPYRPVAGDVTRIHARIVGTLQAALLAVAFVNLTRAIRARRDATEFEQFVRCSVAKKKKKHEASSRNDE